MFYRHVVYYAEGKCVCIRVKTKRSVGDKTNATLTVFQFKHFLFSKQPQSKLCVFFLCSGTQKGPLVILSIGFLPRILLFRVSPDRLPAASALSLVFPSGCFSLSSL